MLNVLLAGGEPETVKILGTYVTVYTRECAVVPVTDMSKIVRMAQDHSPALLFADMDALTDPVGIVKRLGERCPDVKVILYAAIGNSELLQQCMRCDIFDYMYKPLKQSEFLRCLQRAMDDFKDRARRQAEDAQVIAAYESEREVYADLFIRALLDGHVTDEDAITDGLQYFRTALKPDFCVFTVQIDRHDNRHEGMLLTFRMKRLMAESLKAFAAVGFWLCVDGLAAVTAIVSGAPQQARIVEECEKIKDLIAERLDTRVSIGIGASYSSPAQIAVSYREARAALGYCPALGYHSVIPIKVAEPYNSVGYAYPTSAERRFIDNVVMGAYDNCATALKPVIAALDDRMPIALIVRDILHAVNRRAAERGIDIGYGVRFRDQDILTLFTPDDASDYLITAARAICELIMRERTEADAALAKRATDYLNERYYETISPAELAGSLGTTTEHFERVFEDHANMGVYEYTARRRLEEAKGLLRKTAFDDEVIAVKVGYDDAKQLRQAFREYENMSVREFRMGGAHS